MTKKLSPHCNNNRSRCINNCSWSPSVFAKVQKLFLEVCSCVCDVHCSFIELHLRAAACLCASPQRTSTHQLPLKPSICGVLDPLACHMRLSLPARERLCLSRVPGNFPSMSLSIRAQCRLGVGSLLVTRAAVTRLRLFYRSREKREPQRSFSKTRSVRAICRNLSFFRCLSAIRARAVSSGSLEHEKMLRTRSSALASPALRKSRASASSLTCSKMWGAARLRRAVSKRLARADGHTRQLSDLVYVAITVACFLSPCDFRASWKPVFLFVFASSREILFGLLSVLARGWVKCGL